jgi:hypothetical protein
MEAANEEMMGSESTVRGGRVMVAVNPHESVTVMFILEKLPVSPVVQT